MMTEELVEGTLLKQMKAVESWALECYQESIKNSPNNDTIIKNLKKINSQARRMLKYLPTASKDIKGKLDKMMPGLEKQYRKVYNDRYLKPGVTFSYKDYPGREMEKAINRELDHRTSIYYEEQLVPLYRRKLLELETKLEDLKKKITQLRASVVTLRDIKRDEQISSASKRTIRVLSSLATKAVTDVENIEGLAVQID